MTFRTFMRTFLAFMRLYLLLEPDLIKAGGGLNQGGREFVNREISDTTELLLLL